MLRHALLHPDLLRALACAGHGSRVLLADSNFAAWTNVPRTARMIQLNVRPGLVSIDQLLPLVVDAIPVEAASVMAPDDDGVEPQAWAGYQAALGAQVPLTQLPRADFIAETRRPSLETCVVTGDARHYANLLLTVGAVPAPTPARSGVP